MKEKQCETCRYFVDEGVEVDGVEVGRCHLHPPTSYKAFDSFPKVFIDSWCGDWKGKEDESKVNFPVTVEL